MNVMVLYRWNIISKTTIHHSILLLLLMINNDRLVVIIAAMELDGNRNWREELL
jgi:hypothetical protein